MDILEYKKEWITRKGNSCRSFTNWACFYDWVKEGQLKLDCLGFEYEVNQSILYQSWANEEWVEGLDDKIKVELVDIALLDELVDREIREVEEEEKQELFDDLDSYEYSCKSDVIQAITIYYLWESEQVSYWELSAYSELAEEYIENRGLELED